MTRIERNLAQAVERMESTRARAAAMLEAAIADRDRAVIAAISAGIPRATINQLAQLSARRVMQIAAADAPPRSRGRPRRR